MEVDWSQGSEGRQEHLDIDAFLGGSYIGRRVEEKAGKQTLISRVDGKNDGMIREMKLVVKE